MGGEIGCTNFALDTPWLRASNDAYVEHPCPTSWLRASKLWHRDCTYKPIYNDEAARQRIWATLFALL